MTQGRDASELSGHVAGTSIEPSPKEPTVEPGPGTEQRSKYAHNTVRGSRIHDSPERGAAAEQHQKACPMPKCKRGPRN